MPRDVISWTGGSRSRAQKSAREIRREGSGVNEICRFSPVHAQGRRGRKFMSPEVRPSC